VRGAYAIGVLRVMPLNNQKYTFVVSLEASLRPLLDSVTCVNSDEVACRQRALLFFFFSLSLENYSLIIFVIDIST
jgi:hypothetical protein